MKTLDLREQLYNAISSGKVKFKDLTEKGQREYLSYGIEKGYIDKSRLTNKARLLLNPSTSEPEVALYLQPLSLQMPETKPEIKPEAQQPKTVKDFLSEHYLSQKPVNNILGFTAGELTSQLPKQQKVQPKGDIDTKLGLEYAKMRKGETNNVEMLKKQVAEPYPTRDMPKPNFGELSRPEKSFVAGVGDVAYTAGSAADWLGAKDIGQSLQQIGQDIQEKYGQEYGKEFTWKSMFDPDWWATSATRSLPFTLSLIPAAVVGGYAGASAGGALGLGAFGKTVLGALGASALSRPLESALEAGGTYQEALARGMSPEEADRAADETFKNNLKLMGLDAAEFATAFMPTPIKTGARPLVKGLVGAGKLAGAGLMEAGEEGLQDYFSKKAMGDEFSLSDPQTKEALAIGGLMGVGMGASGVAYNTFKKIQDRVYEKLPDEVKVQVDTIVKENIQSGMNEEEAKVKAFDEIAQVPETQTIIEQSTKEIIAELENEMAAFDPQKVKQMQGQYNEMNRAGERMVDAQRAIGQRELQTQDVMGEIPDIKPQTQEDKLLESVAKIFGVNFNKDNIDPAALQQLQQILGSNATLDTNSVANNMIAQNIMKPKVNPPLKSSVSVPDPLPIQSPSQVQDVSTGEVKAMQENIITQQGNVNVDSQNNKVALDRFGEVEVIDSADPSKVKIRTATGAELELGKKAFEKLLIQPQVQQVQQQVQQLEQQQDYSKYYRPELEQMSTKDMSREEVVAKMDKHLENMLNKYGEKILNDPDSGYHSLKAKRDAIANGADYTSKNVASQLIGGVGAALGSQQVNMSGGKTKNVEEAVKAGIEQGKKKEEKQPPKQVKKYEGKISTAKTERGTSIEVQYAIVDINDLIASHDTSLRINKEYPQELQPRERSRAASEMQINNIMNNLEPEFLGESPKASEGAPIVGPDMVVESGNGRVIALKKIYETAHKNEEKYWKWLMNNQGKFGIELNNENTKGFPGAPILVRIRRSNVDRVKFTQESNEQSVASMSATEQAKVDAKKMNDAVLELFVPNENGEILTKENRSFVRAFMDHVVGKDSGRYVTKDGSISQEGVLRIRNAVFAKAYGDTSSIEKLAESTENNIKNITNAMLNVAPQLVKIKESISKGNLYDLDISSEIADAANKLAALRQQGIKVQEYLDQLSLFGDDLSDLAKDVLDIMDKNGRSVKKLTSIFTNYIDGVRLAGNPNQVSMFGNETPTKADVLNVAVKRSEGIDERQTSLFGSEPESSKDTGRTVQEERPKAEVKEEPKQETKKEVTVSTRIPSSELTTEELVQRVKSMSNDQQSAYGLFVKERDLKPEIDAKEFNRIWNSVSANPYVKKENREFKPTHLDTVTNTPVQIEETETAYIITWQNGMTGQDPKQFAKDRYKPLEKVDIKEKPKVIKSMAEVKERGLKPDPASEKKCYELSYEYQKMYGGNLTFGVINGITNNNEYGRISHSWVEQDDYVYDPSYRALFDKAFYYAEVEPNVVEQLTPEENKFTEQEYRKYAIEKTREVKKEETLTVTKKEPWEMTQEEFDKSTVFLNVIWGRGKTGNAKTGELRAILDSQQDHIEMGKAIEGTYSGDVTKQDVISHILKNLPENDIYILKLSNGKRIVFYNADTNKNGQSISINTKELRKQYIEEALAKGENVPEKVLKDYPNLQKKTKKESPKNIGYHAGDLGKSEFLGQQRGSRRDTGHFGTGTYFVGDKKNIDIGSYKDRPMHEIDLSEYNLFKPLLASDASNLHDALRYINTFHEISKGKEIDENLLEDIKYQEPDEQIKSLKEWGQFSEEDFEEASGMSSADFIASKSENRQALKYIKRRIDYLERYNEQVRDAKEKRKNALMYIESILKVKKDDALRIIDEIYDEINQETNNRRTDSASTRFMKRLGYDGIDVRHIPSMDNTHYGSVVYDLKKEPVAEPAPESETTTEPEEPTEETAGQPQSTFTYTEDHFKNVSDFNKKMNEYDYTAADVKAHYEYLLNNKDAIIKKALEVIKKHPKYKNKRNNTKQEMAERYWDNAFKKLGYSASISLQWNPMESNGMENAVARVVNNLTEEQVQEYISEQKAKLEAHKKALENPETLRELQEKKAYVGLNKDEQVQYEEKLAEQQKEQKSTKVVSKLQADADFSIEKSTHTKTGEDIWIVKLNERVDKEAFDEINSKIKKLGGYYSRYVKGFVFNEDPTETLNTLKEGRVEVVKEMTEDRAKAVADKLRTVADNMQSSIDEKFADRLTNTARRARMAASAEADGIYLQKIQKIMRNLADAIESGKAKHLDGVNAKTHVETLNSLLSRIHYEWAMEEQKKGNGRYEDIKSQPIQPEAINNADYPKPWMNKTLLRNLYEDTEGLAGVGQSRRKIKKLLDSRGDDWLVDLTYHMDDVTKLISIASKHGKWSNSNNTGSIDDYKRLHAMGIETVEQYRAALREFLQYREGTELTEEQKRELKIKEIERNVVNSKIEGFFPTPGPIVDKMIQIADIKPGERVLEPSAGKGNIADKLKNTRGNVDIVEYNPTLRDLLKLKGHNVVGNDFLELRPEEKTQWKYEDYNDWSRQLAKNYTKQELENMLYDVNKELSKATKSHLNAINKTTSMQSNSQARAQSRNSVSGAAGKKYAIEKALEIYRFYPENTKEGGFKIKPYDKIIMNPPFENGQDIDHVKHAYELLKPGGRVVAIMSEGPFFRGDKKATGFREWLDEVGGYSKKLPEGAFKNSERSTGVRTRLVVIEKPKGNESIRDIEKKLGKEVNEQIGDSTKLGIMPKGYTPGASGFQWSNPEVEARYKANEGARPEGTIAKLLGKLIRVKHQLTRDFEHLPRTAEFAKLRFVLHKLEKQKDVASDRTLRMMQGFLIKLDTKSYDLYKRKVVIDDQMAELKAGGNLSFGWTAETLLEDYKRLEKELEKYPTVQEAIAKRKEAWKVIKEEYLKSMKNIGFDVSSRLTKEDYFRHQVIAKAQENRLKGGRKLRTPTSRGFLKNRTAGADFNTEYLQAEYEVMAQMLYDIERARAIKEVDKHYNIKNQLKIEALKINHANIMAFFTQLAAQSGADPVKLYKQTLNWKQAIGFSNLQNMALSGELPDTTDGKWKSAIDSLKVGADGEEARSEVMDYLAWLMKEARDEEVKGNAAMIFKGIQEKKKFIQEILGDKYVTWEDLIPEGYTVWQPREGRVMYMVDTIPARMAEELYTGALKELGVTEEDLRKAFSLGQRFNEFVIKEEIAETLDNLTIDKGDRIGIIKDLQTAWKVWVLLSPGRWFKYNARNISGDADAMFAGNPSAFKKVPQAVRELYALYAKDKAMTENMQDWFERGGMQTLLQVQEAVDVNKLKMFNQLLEKKNIGSKTNLLSMYWKGARLSTDFREAILRYAAYLDYLEQMQNNGGTPKNFGASIPEEVMALDDIKDRAFKLSNELLGAYDQISVLGQKIRETLIPFWSWNEVNFTRYIQLIKNAANDKRIAEVVGRKLLTGVVVKSPLIAMKVGKLAIQTTGLWVILTLWNNLIFGDLEDDLPEEEKNKPHIILGKDEKGRAIYFSRMGALQDFLEWFGVDAGSINNVKDILNGKKSVKEVAKEMAKGPVNKLVQGVNPLFKLPWELAFGRKAFPDIFEPSSIRDKGLHVAQSLGLTYLYRKIQGLPNKPFQDAVRNIFVYTNDPEESIYYKVLEAKYDYLKSIGRNTEIYSRTPRSEALYNLKTALRYKDKQAAKKYFLEYIANGGDGSGLKRSLEYLHPLSGMNKDVTEDFLNTLTNKEKEELNVAIKFYHDIINDLAREKDVLLEGLEGRVANSFSKKIDSLQREVNKKIGVAY